MRAKDFWSGFAAGSAASFAGVWIAGLLGRGGRSRIIRLEKSIQIGRPLEDVFQTWRDLESFPRYTGMLRSVQRSGDLSYWVANVGGKPVEWSAQIAQVIPNQSIGWHSLKGPKHSGRVTFSPMGQHTLVHVQMNYAPRPWILRPLLSPASGMLEGYIEQALRDFKGALESGAGISATSEHAVNLTQATGTYGPAGDNPRFGSPTIPVEFTAPPESKR